MLKKKKKIAQRNTNNPFSLLSEIRRLFEQEGQGPGSGCSSNMSSNPRDSLAHLVGFRTSHPLHDAAVKEHSKKPTWYFGHLEFEI